jgi:receptor-type tyrosine-protein phosphatase gamma
MNMFFHFIFLARPRTEPYTEYRVIVIAFTLKYDGEPSDPVIQRTDIAGPSAPQIINLTCHSQDALYLQWKRPTTFYNSIDFYVINYKESSYSNFQQIQLNTTAAFAETAVCGHLMLLLFRLCL